MIEYDTPPGETIFSLLGQHAHGVLVWSDHIYNSLHGQFDDYLHIQKYDEAHQRLQGKNDDIIYVAEQILQWSEGADSLGLEAMSEEEVADAVILISKGKNLRSELQRMYDVYTSMGTVLEPSRVIGESLQVIGGKFDDMRNALLNIKKK